MYRPRHFSEDRPDILAAFVRAHPLGLLITAAEGGLTANPIPMELDGNAACWILRGHVARANPVWRETHAGSEVLVVFGGAGHYVSPGWYPSKRAHGKVVPTWNYALVQARGHIRFVEDTTWLHALVARLTDHHEAARTTPWAVSDAPANFVARQLRAIVGFEITLTALEGKFKASQNRDLADRQGVAEGLTADGLSRSDIAWLVREPQEGSGTGQ